MADAQYIFGSLVLGQKNPTPKIEKTKTSKADLIAALKVAFAYCDKAYDGMTDVSATEMVKFFGGDTSPQAMTRTTLACRSGDWPPRFAATCGLSRGISREHWLPSV